jgi:hypothetical protein
MKQDLKLNVSLLTKKEIVISLHQHKPEVDIYNNCSNIIQFIITFY